MILPGHSVQQDHWKDSTSRKQENLSHSVNRTSLIVLPVTAITGVKEDSWTMLSDTSKLMVE